LPDLPPAEETWPDLPDLPDATQTWTDPQSPLELDDQEGSPQSECPDLPYCNFKEKQKKMS